MHVLPEANKLHCALLLVLLQRDIKTMEAAASSADAVRPEDKVSSLSVSRLHCHCCTTAWT